MLEIIRKLHLYFKIDGLLLLATGVLKVATKSVKSYLIVYI